MNPFYSLDDQLVDAVFLSDVEDVRALLGQGASPDARDDDRRTALQAAVEDGNAEIVAVLLDAGADPDAPDRDGRTALHVAAQRHAFDLVWLLIRHGANANVQDNDGNSALWRALLGAGGRSEIVEFLRRHGARDDLENAAGIAPAEIARRHGLPLRAAVCAGPH